MSAAIRFLGVALAGWIGLRAASLGLVPGAEALAVIPGFTPPPQIALYDPPSPAPPIQTAARTTPAVPSTLSAAAITLPRTFSPTPATDALTQPRRTPEPKPEWFSPIPQLDDWPLSRVASSSRSRRQSIPARTTPGAAPVSPRLDRISLTTWAMLRQIPAGTALPDDSLASGGTLGGSQAGARLAYAFNRALAASLRMTSNVGGENGAEVALGMRWTPLRSLPVAITAERRQRIGKAGRSAFALFAEGGVYDRPMPLKFALVAYAQAGVVGFRRSDLFADGAMTFTRPVWRRFSAGAGVWGGVQPGVYRFDAGPRVSLRIGRSMRVHLDYRQRIAGNAAPGSGPAVTIAGDF